MEFLRDWQTWIIVIIILFIVLWIYIKVSNPVFTATQTRTQSPDVITITPTQPATRNSEKLLTSPVVSSFHTSAEERQKRVEYVVQLTREEAEDDDRNSETVSVKQSVGERECTKVFHELFGAKNVVTQARNIEWLVNPLTGRKLELDGYCPKHKIAFEYNGEGHYKVVPQFHPHGERSLHYQQWKDNLKVDLCDANGIYLITIPYTVRKEDIRKYIINNLPAHYKQFRS